jgi:CheY-like chemotaxis protein/HAMP domain-containing protein
MMNIFAIRQFFSGLSRRVLLWFLLLSLVPLSTNSWLNYQSARERLYKATELALADVTAIQTESLRTSMARMMADLEQEAERPANVVFLQSLEEGFQHSGKTLSDYVGSFSWAMDVDGYEGGLKRFWHAYNYRDILLGDNQGNILFSFSRGQDLGSNLFQGDLHETRFAAAATKALDTGEIIFSDLDYYPASSGLLCAFLVMPMLDEQADKIGFLAFQISVDQLVALVEQDARAGRTGRRYLIGADLTLRIPGALGDSYPVLQRRVETQQTRAWYQAHVFGKEDDHSVARVTSYPGPNGKQVLGLHSAVEIADVNWGYIAEIDRDEALAGAIVLARVAWVLIGVTVLLVFLVALSVTRRIVRPIVEISDALSGVSQGNLAQQITLQTRDELRNLVDGFNGMISSLRHSEREAQENSWLEQGASELKDRTQGDISRVELAEHVIGFLCPYLGASVGVFYLLGGPQIRSIAGYACNPVRTFRLGEGLVGQAAVDGQVLSLTGLTEDALVIDSGLIASAPKVVTVVPLRWNNRVVVLREFGSMQSLTVLQKRLLDMVGPIIAVAMQTALARERTQELLEETQAQAEELQAREEELRNSNGLLEQQTRDLKHSERQLQEKQTLLEEQNAQLQAQQEELRVANEELEHKARELERSRDDIHHKNHDLELVRSKLEEHAQELALASKYKSQFLANMSHELRTPLNSLLILARLLADNKEGNLSGKQVEFCQTIYDSGNDLLLLINDILDLSKIEAGKMDLSLETIELDGFLAGLERKFRPMAEARGIGFHITTAEIPPQLHSDTQKISQVMKNLLSNAIKFTDSGEVRLHVALAAGDNPLNKGAAAGDVLEMRVSDSGIGIAEKKLEAIFQAFQQGDGSMRRKYGGTGLGLSISRQLARLLGGDILVESELGRGAVFRLFIPVDAPRQRPVDAVAEEAAGDGAQRVSHQSTAATEAPQNSELAPAEAPVVAPVAVASPTAPVADDRAGLTPGDRSVLIIEDDVRFAGILADAARQRGFKVLVAEDGEIGLYFADFYLPSCIVLDIGLPGMDGWQVMQRLKGSLKTRHIPVHFMSASDKTPEAMRSGAVGFLAKPASPEDLGQLFARMEQVLERSVKRLLLIEDDPVQLNSIRELIANDDVEIVTAASAAEAAQSLAEQSVDCIVLDLGLPDRSGLEFLEEMRGHDSLSQVPVIVYTGRELEPEERAALDRYAQSIIIKNVRSLDRLLDDTALFLHRVESQLPPQGRQMLHMLHDRESLFDGRKVLLVDDDMRNVFALSAVLQEKNMQVLVAKNGLEALERLQSHGDTAIVLMDIMMPEMDGYEATRRIRQQEAFRNLPVIALTAKAMKGDRSLCIEAGASDYLTKPVDSAKLLSLMRVWLYR